MDTADWLEEKDKAADGVPWTYEREEGDEEAGCRLFARNYLLERGMGRELPPQAIGYMGFTSNAQAATLGRNALPVLAAALRALERRCCNHDLPLIAGEANSAFHRNIGGSTSRDCYLSPSERAVITQADALRAAHERGEGT